MLAGEAVVREAHGRVVFRDVGFGIRSKSQQQEGQGLSHPMKGRSCGLGERFPLQQKPSGRQSPLGPWAGPARQALVRTLVGIAWIAGKGSPSLSLSFRNGPWHPSSRKFVMGE